MKSGLFSTAANILQKVSGGEQVTISGFHGNRIMGAAIQLEKLAAQYKRLEDIAILRHDRPKQRVSEITIITDDIAIVEVTSNDEPAKYFYILGERASSTYSEDKEIAVLNAYAEKYEGLNSDFANYACKMLGKEIK